MRAGAALRAVAAAAAACASAQWAQNCANSSAPQTHCPDDATCAPNLFSGNSWGCCPFADATVCRCVRQP